MSEHLSKEHFCILPWVHLHLSPNGEIHSCCRSDFKNALGSIHQDELKTIWNNEPFKKMRREMLNNVKLSNCSDCYQQESNNQESMRQKSNSDWSEMISLVEQTTIDGHLEIFEPTYLDLRFNNICNFKCRTCSPHFSTSWYPDIEELKIPFETKKLTSSKNEDQLWRELLDLMPKVKRVYFAGGEPLIQQDHYFFLDRLLQLGMTDTTLSYNTNLSTLNFGDKNILDYWKKFSNAWVYASIDGIEKKGEYIRKGMSWEKVYANRLEIKKQCPHVHFVVYWTLSLFNAFHLIEALEFFIKHQFIENGDQFEINILNEPQIYNIKLFNSVERAKLKSLYADFIDRLNSLNFQNSEKLITQLNYVMAYLDSDEWPTQRSNFWAFTRKLDRIRGENFLNLFPELNSLYEIPFSDQNG